MTLSGGMKRRVLIAKALSHEPRILFLDEPTAGVDVELRHEMWKMVHGLRERGVTIILTTHYIEEAQEMADRIGVMSKGRLIKVEDKDVLMKTLGRKRLTLTLREPLESVPAALADRAVALENDGTTLVYTFETQVEETGICELMQRLAELKIDFKDLRTSESSLEEIFVGLVQSDRTEEERA
jgi:ABC-2 type transport system ATP-binding protein